MVEPNGRDSLGAEVTVMIGERQVTRTVRAAYSYLASNDPRVHIGLGPATKVTSIVVRWPNGASETFGDLDADRVVTLQGERQRHCDSVRGSLRYSMVTTFYPPYSFGGDGIFVQRLSHELAARGHTVDVVHCIDAYRGMSAAAPANATPEPPGVTVHGLRSRFGVLWPLSHASDRRPVVPRRGRATNTGSALRRDSLPQRVVDGRARRPGLRPRSEAVHDARILAGVPHHVLYRFQREPCERPTCLSCTIAHKRPPQLWRYTGKMSAAVKHVHAFLALSEFAVQAHRRRGFDGPIKLLPPFVPLPNLPNRRSARPTGHTSCLSGGWKRSRDCTLDSTVHADLDAELWIAGAGSQDQELRRLAAGNARVRFFGYVSEPRLSRLYRQAVALVVPRSASRCSHWSCSRPSGSERQ